MRNLRHLPDSEEFGLRHGHPLGLEEEVTEVLVTPPPTEQSFDVAVDGFHHSEANSGPAEVQDSFEVVEEHLGQLLKGLQCLPSS